MWSWRTLTAVLIGTVLVFSHSKGLVTGSLRGPGNLIRTALAQVLPAVTSDAPDAALNPQSDEAQPPTDVGQADELAPQPPQQPPVVRPTAPADGTGAVSPFSDGLAPALEPFDPLMPEPAPVPAVWQPLDKVVRELAGDFQGRMSVTAVDLTTMARYDFRPGDRYYPASTFKLPVTICTVEAIERGELTWETLVTFTEEDDDTVGAGGFANVSYGTKWPVRNLLDRSIISSNNVAVKMLARTLTWEGLRTCTERLGGMVTRTAEGSTPVSSADEAAWWLAVWRMKQERPAVAENLLRPLRLVTYWGRIQAGTPRGDLVTHKFGTYPPYEHDGAIIWADRPYLLVVMTYGGSHETADWLIARVARAAWDSMLTAQ